MTRSAAARKRAEEILPPTAPFKIGDYTTPVFPPSPRNDRPSEFQIMALRASPALGDKFLNLGGTDKASLFIRSNILRSRGDALKTENKFFSAREMYTLAAQALVGTSIPVTGGRSEAYMALKEWEVVELMACFNGIVGCLFKLKNYEEVRDYFLPIRCPSDLNLGLDVAHGIRHAL
jgi:hypothetical protein